LGALIKRAALALMLGIAAPKRRGAAFGPTFLKGLLE
jgi:hypothetical protein